SRAAAAAAGGVHDDFSADGIVGGREMNLAALQVELSMHGMQHVAESEIHCRPGGDKVQDGLLLRCGCKRSRRAQQNKRNESGDGFHEVGVLGSKHATSER